MSRVEHLLTIVLILTNHAPVCTVERLYKNQSDLRVIKNDRHGYPHTKLSNDYFIELNNNYGNHPIDLDS